MAAAIWGTVGPAQVLSGSHADPGALGALRLLVGGAVLALPLWRRLPWASFRRNDVWPWLVAAAGSTALYQALFLYAVDLTGAAIGTTITLGCAPFATGVFAWWWLRQRPGRRWLWGTVAAVAGCALILAPASDVRIDPLGVVFAVISGCCYGGYTVSAKKFIDTGLSPTVTIAATLILGGALLTPLILWHPGALVEPETLLLIGWIGVVGTSVAYLLFGRGLSLTTASTVGTLSLIEPLTAALLGVLVLNEHLTAPAFAGCLVLLAGLIAVSLPGRRRTLPVSTTSRSTPTPPGHQPYLTAPDSHGLLPPATRHPTVERRP